MVRFAGPRNPARAAEIGHKVGRAVGRFKVAKHFHLEIADGACADTRDTDAIAAEDAVRGYKVLIGVEE